MRILTLSSLPHRGKKGFCVMSIIISVPKAALSLGIVRAVYGPHHSIPIGKAKVQKGNYFIPSWDEVLPTEENIPSKDDQDLLDLEVTPQIEIILNSLLLQKAQEAANNRTLPSTEDIHKDIQQTKLLKAFLDTIELQDKTMERIWKKPDLAEDYFRMKDEMDIIRLKNIPPQEKQRKKDLKALNQLHTNWNNFLKSDKYQHLNKQERNILWEVYKNKMAATKAAYATSKETLNKSWEAWKALRTKKEASPIHKLWSYYGQLCEHRNKLQETNPSFRLWPEFFNLKNLDINTYWSVSDPKEFDDQEHLKVNKLKTLECLKSSHLSEMWATQQRFAYTKEYRRFTGAWKKKAPFISHTKKVADKLLSMGNKELSDLFGIEI